jgi:hypothetical protein
MATKKTFRGYAIYDNRTSTYWTGYTWVEAAEYAHACRWWTLVSASAALAGVARNYDQRELTIVRMVLR